MHSSRQKTLQETTHTHTEPPTPSPPHKKREKRHAASGSFNSLRCIKLLSDRNVTLLHPDMAAGVRPGWTRVCVCVWRSCKCPSVLVIMAPWSWELKSSLALYLNPAAMSLTWTLERPGPAGYGSAQQRDSWLFNGRRQGRLPPKCFIFWPERMGYFLCWLRWLNFDKSSVGQSALYDATATSTGGKLDTKQHNSRFSFLTHTSLMQHNGKRSILKGLCITNCISVSQIW